MADAKSVLLVGETWVSAATHYKGFDQFGSVTFHFGAEPLVEALKGSEFELLHMAAHEAVEKFPFTMEELNRYDAVLLSDIGANSLLLHPDVWLRGKPVPNRLKLIRDWTAAGGGLVMIGGYLTFQGIDGRARWHRTAVEEALPVTCLPNDDRIEAPEGFRAEVTAPDSPLVQGLPASGRCCSGRTRCFSRTGRTSSSSRAFRPSRAATRCSSAGASGAAGRRHGPPISARTGCRRASSSGPAMRRSGRTCCAG